MEVIKFAVTNLQSDVVGLCLSQDVLSVDLLGQVLSQEGQEPWNRLSAPQELRTQLGQSPVPQEDMFALEL